MMKQIKHANRLRGWTLIELMTFLVFIAVPLGFVVTKVFHSAELGRETMVADELNGFKQAITLYRLQTGEMPQSLDDLLVQPGEIKGWKGPYLPEKRLKDPWSNTYQYKIPGDHGRKYDLFSMGPDGNPDTSDDIVSWKTQELLAQSSR